MFKNKKEKKTIISLLDEMQIFEANLHKISEKAAIKNPEKLQKHLLNKAKFIFFDRPNAELYSAGLRYAESRQEADRELIQATFKQIYDDNFDNSLSNYLAKEVFGEKIGALFNILFPDNTIFSINHENVSNHYYRLEDSHAKAKFLRRAESDLNSIDDKALNYIKGQIKLALYTRFCLNSIDSFFDLVANKSFEEISKIRQQEMPDELIVKYKIKYVEFKNLANFKKLIELKFKKEIDAMFPVETLRYFAELHCELNSIRPDKAQKAQMNFINNLKQQIFLSISLLSASRHKNLHKIFDIQYQPNGKVKIYRDLTDAEILNARLINDGLSKFKEKGKFSEYDLFGRIEDFSVEFTEESRNEVHKLFTKEFNNKLPKALGIEITKSVIDMIEYDKKFLEYLNICAKKVLDDKNEVVFKAFLKFYKETSDLYCQNGIFEYALRKQDLYFCKLFNREQFEEFFKDKNSYERKLKAEDVFYPELLEQALDLFFKTSNSKSDGLFIDYLINELNIKFDAIFIRKKIKNNEIFDYYQRLFEKLTPSAYYLGSYGLITKIMERLEYQISSQNNYDFDAAEAFLKVSDKNEFFRNIKLGSFSDHDNSILLYPENFFKYPLLVKSLNLKMTFDSEQIKKYDLDFLMKFYQIEGPEVLCRKIYIEKNIKGESIFVEMVKLDRDIKDIKLKFKYLCDMLSKNPKLFQIIISSGEGFGNMQHHNWGPFEYAQDFLISSMRDDPKNFETAQSNYKMLQDLNFPKSPNAINVASFAELKNAYGKHGGVSLLAFGQKFYAQHKSFFSSNESVYNIFEKFLKLLEIKLPHGDLFRIQQITYKKQEDVSWQTSYRTEIDTFNKTPLHLAVEAANYLVCERILSRNLKDINAITSEKTYNNKDLENKPIHLIKWKDESKKKANLEILKLLIVHGADPFEDNGIGNSTFMLGLQHDIKEILFICKDLIEKDPKILKKQNIFGQTICHKLAMWSHADLFSEIANYGCDVWLQDAQGDTCLDYVAKNIEDGNHKGFGHLTVDTFKTNMAIVDHIFCTDAKNSYKKVEGFLDKVIRQNRVKVLTVLIEKFPIVFALINERSNILKKIQGIRIGESKMLNAYLEVAKRSSIIKVFDDRTIFDDGERVTKRSKSPSSASFAPSNSIAGDGGYVAVSRPASPSNSIASDGSYVAVSRPASPSNSIASGGSYVEVSRPASPSNSIASDGSYVEVSRSPY